MKRRAIIGLAVFLMLVNVSSMNCSGGKDNLEWEKTFSGSQYRECYYGHQTSDGGFIMTGYINQYATDETDVWLVKTDTNGNELWEKIFGDYYSDKGYCVQQTSDGGYVIAGETPHYYGCDYTSVWLIKTDTNGNEEWNKVFGSSSGNDIGRFVQQTTNGGYIIAGDMRSYGTGMADIWLIKTDSSGDELWNKTFGGLEMEWGYSVQQTSDGGYIIIGYTESFGAGGYDFWMIKIDSDGNELWDKTFGGSNDDMSYSLLQTNDGGYVIAGRTESYGAGKSDVWLIRTDSEGNLQWEKTFGGLEWDSAQSMQQTTDGGYIMAGNTSSYGNRYGEAWFIKTDVDVNEEWSKTFGSDASDRGFYAQQVSNGSYIFGGVNLLEVWLIKFEVE